MVSRHEIGMLMPVIVKILLMVHLQLYRWTTQGTRHNHQLVDYNINCWQHNHAAPLSALSPL